MSSSRSRKERRSSATPAPKQATLISNWDGPGGRHDNDHADVCRIQILPSSEEISSLRAEYLPLNDPTQWHLAGIEGVLDRNLRLLREDGVGQLRHAVHQLIESSQSYHSGTPQLRHNHYNNARIARVKWDEFLGLQIEIAFPQPGKLSAMSIADRKIWWQTSKRLQFGTLFCLICDKRFVLFCTVASQSPPWRNNARAMEEIFGLQELWNDKADAHATFTLVDLEESNMRALLGLLGVNTRRFSMFEFPNVLRVCSACYTKFTKIQTPSQNSFM
ncbi:NF-X1 finger and helicase protein [Penicillium cosmopolitanum]|uniref:NF-X1 finger and helicase protein n=1 Tax=Penicillium cosmopolitanum TaxID=1131564 RepID=A0A9W9VNI5_9EURO|nr:NF-X1 finger and helicase protein [Penicillium cosmopolitanum]KAJ5386370.1 NF-X1 finger and helicase protein [Penicillium cosmopolitanum]